MRLYFQTLILILVVTQMSNAQGVRFEQGSWEEVQAKAKATNKFIFVDAVTATCSPCKWMEKEVFPKKAVGAFFNKHFINYKFFMEKGEGIAFAKKYKVFGYPTSLYFTPLGKLVHRNIGALDDQDLLREGRNALNPQKQYYTLKQQYELGKSDPEFLKNYVIAAAWNGMSEIKPSYYNKLVSRYLTKVGKARWSTRVEWKFIQQYALDIQSEAFAYVMKHPDKFTNQKEVDQYREKIIGVRSYQVIRSSNISTLSRYKELLQKLLGAKAAPVIAEVTYKFYQRRKEATFEQAQQYFDQHCNDEYELNQGAEWVRQQYTTKDKLEVALKWVNKSINLEANADNTETKGRLLFKLLRYAEAKKAVEQALEFAEKEKRDIQALTSLLEDINSKL